MASQSLQLFSYVCSAQFENLCNFEIALCILRIPSLRSNLEIEQAIKRLHNYHMCAISRSCDLHPGCRTVWGTSLSELITNFLSHDVDIYFGVKAASLPCTHSSSQAGILVCGGSDCLSAYLLCQLTSQFRASLACYASACLATFVYGSTHTVFLVFGCSTALAHVHI